MKSEHKTFLPMTTCPTITTVSWTLFNFQLAFSTHSYILLPSTCGCGAKFSVEHVLSWVPLNEIRDKTANLLIEVCNDVGIEPELQPITGEYLTGPSSNVQDGACLDIAANGFWGGRFEELTLMSEFSNHMPHPTSDPASLHVTASMNL